MWLTLCIFFCRTLFRDVAAGIDPDLDAQVEFGAFQKLGDPTTRRQVAWYNTAPVSFTSIFDFFLLDIRYCRNIDLNHRFFALILSLSQKDLVKRKYLIYGLFVIYDEERDILKKIWSEGFSYLQLFCYSRLSPIGDLPITDDRCLIEAILFGLFIIIYSW